MSDKDAKLIAELARADIRNSFVQKIAAAVAASPVLSASCQKRANSLMDAAGSVANSLSDATGSVVNYLNERPTLALALGGAGLGGASALGAGLVAKKKPRRLVGHALGGALAGAALGGGLGAIGHSIAPGSTLSGWARGAKDLFKKKDVAKDEFEDKAVAEKLRRDSPALHSSLDSAVKNTDADPNADNRDKLRALTELASDAGSYDLKGDPGANDFPNVNSDTQLNTSPFQLSTITGDRDATSLLSPSTVAGGAHLGLGGIAEFNRYLIKHKHSPLNLVNLNRPSVNRWVGERLKATLDSIKSEADDATKLRLARELIGAASTVPDDHIRQVIDQLSDRADQVVNAGASPSSLFSDINTGRVAVDSTLASDISKRWRDAAAASPQGFERQLAGKGARPPVNLKPDDWKSFWTRGISSNQNAADLANELDNALSQPATAGKSLGNLFNGTALQEHLMTPDINGKPTLNIPLVRAMRDYLRLDAAKRQVQDFSYNPDGGLGDSLLTTLGLDKRTIPELKSMGLVSPDGKPNIDRLRALAEHDPASLVADGMTFDAGQTTRGADLENAGRRAYLDQAPAMSHAEPISATAQAVEERANHWRLPWLASGAGKVREVANHPWLPRGMTSPGSKGINPLLWADWAINSNKPQAKLVRAGGRYGVLPGIAALTALDSLDQQSKAEVLLKKLDEEGDRIDPAVRAELKRRILATLPAVGVK
jgi:hypothetical protein